MIRIAIPIRPHLKKYLQDFYDTPYILSQKDDMGLFLYHLLRRRKFRDPKYFCTSGLTDSLDVIISDSFTFDQGCLHLNPYQTHIFNLYLEKVMMRHCITWIMAAEMADMNNKRAIIKWIERYELDEGSVDWYDRIKKNYFRYRQAKKTRKTTVQIVP